MAAADASPAKPPSALAAALTALGIVYGDLGTSPLYTLQTVVEATGGQFTAQSALGILSLIVWTLIITVSVKYCLLVMRADNHGEGGILALMSLVGANRGGRRIGLLTGAGLLGAALIYGDGVITPAISVLSALEGVNAVTPTLSRYVLPLAVLILVGLFAVQRFGADRIGRAFGPVMLAWFGVIGVLGLGGVIRHPAALAAIDPRLGLSFLFHAKAAGALILGGVFLCATGGEALYADMGHIGRRPIQLSWYFIVLPALLLSYAGQTGYLLDHGKVAGNPFFLIAPAWAVYPMVALATVATIIASQSIITGSFSMTRQAMQLGWMPGVDIRQTSDRVYGQIYVPVVNGLMMVATLVITIGFGSSERLAGAYGTAVATTMFLTTILLFNAMLKIWRWPLIGALAAISVFAAVDLAFFAANLLKVADGGWLPLTLGGLVFFVMTTWRAGADGVHDSLSELTEPDADFLAELRRDQIPRVPGVAVFLSREGNRIPSLAVDYVRTIGSLHQHVVIATVVFVEAPRVEEADRASAEPIGDGLVRVTLRYGFVEIPDLPRSLVMARCLDPSLDLSGAVYFGARDLIVRKPAGGRLRGVRLVVFAWLFHNGVKMIDRFRLPPRNVIEFARQLEI